ncbi:ankyrin repeat domain-containing protein [bacterium]|nr:ankyrin repeat domain-containing protein [bacterium]
MFSFIRNIFKETLHRACEKSNIEAVKQFLADGADVNAKDEDGKTPLDYAEGETAVLLRKHGGKTSYWFKAGESIHIATVAGHIEAVKQHLAAGADVDVKDDGESTPLHYAAFEGHKEIAELLIAEDADVNAKDKAPGGTPLHNAADEGHKEVIELLIAKGADVNANSDDYGTPLDWAINGRQAETINLLRKHGGKTGEGLKAEEK